jgi:hypothetical protein
LSRSFHILDCVTTPTGSYLHVERSVKCWEGAHAAAGSVAILTLVMAVVLPGLLAWQLRKAVAADERVTDKALAKRFVCDVYASPLLLTAVFRLR